MDLVKDFSTQIPVPTFHGLEIPTPVVSPPSAPASSRKTNSGSDESSQQAASEEAASGNEEEQPKTESRRSKLKYKDFLPQELKKGGFLIRHAERWEPLTIVLSRAKEWMDDMESTPALRKKFKILSFQTMFVDYNETEFFKDQTYVPYGSGQVQIVRVFYEQLS